MIVSKIIMINVFQNNEMERLFLCFLVSATMIPPAKGTQKEDGRVVCYINTWAQYRPKPAQFLPGLTDPFLCTHAIYAHANITGTEILPAEPDDVQRYKELQKLKLANPQLKTMLSVGGPLLSPAAFSNISRDAALRKRLAQNAAMFLRSHGFDGLDIDWRYLVHSDVVSDSEDRALYSTLLEDIRFAFDNEAKTANKDRLLLSSVIPGRGPPEALSSHLQEVAKSVDFLNVLSVDLVGHWGATSHPSPLCYQEDSSAVERPCLDSVARSLVAMGLNPGQLSMGLSFHGLTFVLMLPQSTGIGALSTGGGPAGNYTSTRGALAYFEICQVLPQATELQYLEEQRVPYLVAKDVWVGYEDRGSLQKKVQYLRNNGFGGVAVWYIDEDDFSGTFCNQGHFPLLTTVSKQFLT